MLSAFRAASRRLMPAVQPALAHRASVVSGPPKDPMSFTVCVSARWPSPVLFKV